MAKFSSIFLSRVRRSASSTVVIAALTTLNPASLHAEGAFQMGLEQWMLDNQRAIDQGYATDDASASLFVDILSAGEVINVSLCGASTTDDITVEFYAPSNNTTPVSTQSLTDANMSCTDPMTAPLTNPMRYTTLETGAYRLVLQNTTNTDFADSVFTRYDITVTPDAATDPDPSEAGGRLWAYSYSFNARGFEEENSTDANYYAKVPGGRPNTEYIWQLDLNNFAGYGYNLSANSVGVDAPNSGYSTPTASNGASYLHKMYVSYPAQYDPRPTTPPTLSAVRFVDSSGQDYAISPGATSGIQDDGVFEFTTDVTGTYSVLIDLNQDGIYGNAGDRQLLGEAVIGLNQVPWDGRDAAGNAPALGVYYSQVQIHMGEYHFIANDAETSGGTEDGLTVHLANPDGTVEPTKVYWDDVTLMPAGGTSNTPNGAFSNTPEGKHTWGDFVSSSFGNNSFLDTYVYGLAEVSYAPTAVINDDTLQVNFDGTVTADPFSTPGNAVAISVSDEDLNTSASSIETVDVEVVNDITGEVEMVTLTETGPNTGVFAATMPTTAGTTAGADNNGSMNTKPADTLTVSYIDLIAEDLTSKIPTAAVTVAFDTDGDGIPDSTDLDDDNDGIADAAEGAGDTDGDGIPNSLDTDSDNDGILDSEEDTTSPTLLGTDSDLDGIDDAVDASITGGPDTNSDGVDDTFAPTDTDADDLPDHLDMDSDADGILDSYETTIDTDNDNTPDYLDLDSDGDGIPDAVEDTTTPALLGTDADADGIDDAIDVSLTGGTDADGNGIDDAFEPTDLDTDNAPNHLDFDSDGDGIDDSIEAGPTPATPVDSNGDAEPDYLDTDSDGDGIPDAVEAGITSGGPRDTDGDNIPDYLDTDSDGDGIDDAIEAGSTPGTPVDTDGDGTPDTLDTDSDGDGIPDANEGSADTDGDGIPDVLEGNIDTDGDGTANYLDLDSDNDGIPDSVEAGATPDTPLDSDNDGTLDFLDIDSDDDGIADIYETTIDTDTDNTPDYLDLDSDGDGIPDAIEDTTTPPLLGTDADADGIDDAIDVTQTGGTDANGNGIDDAIEPTDLDTDAAPNHLELDSDGDGIPDAVEAGLNPETPADTDNDGVADFLDTDSDGDGISDAIEAGPVGSTPLDTDGDGTPNFLDLDADNDGTPDATEAGSNPDTPVDSDGNGVPDFMESDLVDSDGDGISDEVEGTTDSDGDGIPDFQDTDSDNDGIPDSLEAGPTPSTPLDTDNDGIPDLLDIDSDNDGLLDQDETAIDNDRDGVADFRDLDSDNDGLTDAYEAGGTDTDANGIIDGFTDSNGDGWDDFVAAQPLPDNDFDGDGIVDHLDVDSDNDGLPDLAESNDFSADTDGNGRVDNFTDANNDGLDDSVAVFPLTADDVDNDGAPDHLDLDTDNDGVSDLLEAGGTDANGDNMVDAVLDTDGDGIPDVVDIDQTPGNDSDSDGIIDSADIDSNATAQDTDGDGIIDAADPDQDGDGFADFQADGTGSPNIDIIADNNNNGIPDIDEPISGATSDALIRTGVDGGCSIGGTDSRDPLLPLLALVSIAYLLRRRSLRIPALLSSILVGSVMIAPNNVAIAAEEPTSLSSRQAQDRADDRLRRQIYIGFGFGSSTLTPDTSELVDWDVSDDSDSGMQFTLGYDVNRWFSVEAHATELGDAGLSPMGSINYKTNGISALFYVGKARHRHKRHGLTAYGRIGLGGLVNTRSDDTVPYSQDNSNHLLFGLGAEYTGRRGLGVRAEFIQFDTDAQYAQLGLIYRFGKTKKRPRYSQQQITEQAPQAVTQALPEITPTPSTSIAADGDADGVSDNIDLCLDTSAGTAVDAKGCALFNGVLEGVNFESGSAALTTNARVILTEVAATLRAYPDMRFVLSAHTDDQGATKANQELSKQRVISVARFLRNAGIDVSRFSLKAYGELRPIADNTTAAGRAKNRRVEMKAIK